MSANADIGVPGGAMNVGTEGTPSGTPGTACEVQVVACGIQMSPRKSRAMTSSAPTPCFLAVAM